MPLWMTLNIAVLYDSLKYSSSVSSQSRHPVLGRYSAHATRVAFLGVVKELLRSIVGVRPKITRKATIVTARLAEAFW